MSHQKRKSEFETMFNLWRNFILIFLLSDFVRWQISAEESQFVKSTETVKTIENETVLFECKSESKSTS